MNLPLTIHILFHKEYNDGYKIYSDLYKLLCRDSRNPFSGGMGIPVYFYTNNVNEIIYDINTSNSEKTFILLLIDQKMYMSSIWRQFINEKLSKICNKSKNIRLISVALYKYAYELNTHIAKTQFINFHYESVYNHYEEFKLRLYDCLIRFLSNENTHPLNIFISHSKHDSDRNGIRLAENLRNYLLESGTKLSSFFDINSIIEGYDFEEQINENIDHSIMIVIFSNTYSSREWCIKEIMHAKMHMRPVIAVFAIDGKVDRLFPYIGNVPATIYDNDWNPIINLLLHTTLNHIFQEKLLTQYKKEDTSIREYFPCAPDAFLLSTIKNPTKNFKIIYPEPPIGKNELEVLNKLESSKKIEYLTPMQYNGKKFNLNGKSIAISVSTSDNQFEAGIGQEMIDDVITEIIRHIFIANGKIVYGGDIIKNGLTERFRDLSYQYGQYQKLYNETKTGRESDNAYYVTSFLAWPYYSRLTDDQKCEFKHSMVDIRIIKPDGVSEEESILGIPKGTKRECELKKQRALTKMRNAMESEKFIDDKKEESEIIARIFLGGKTSEYSGKMPGLLEEFLIAIDHKHPVFLIGGFGGMTRRIIDVITNKCSDIPALNGITINSLNIHVEDNKLKILFYSTNIFEIVPILLEALNNIK